MKKAVILTSFHPASVEPEEKIFILGEFASDCGFFSIYKNPIWVTDLISNIHDIQYQACDLASKLCFGEPKLRGMAQFSIFREAITNECLKILCVMKLHDLLISEGITCCRFLFPSWVADTLYKVACFLNKGLEVKIKETEKKNIIKKIYQTQIKSGLDVNKFLFNLNILLDNFDPFHKRSIFLIKNKKKINKNRLWFYSTALTYTNAGLHYEPFFPEPFSFLIENPYTGGAVLKKIKRPFDFLYDFSSKTFIPNKNEIEEAVSTIHGHVLNTKIDKKEEMVRTIFLSSSWYQSFIKEKILKGLYMSSIFENWVEHTEPALLAVGNPGFEGYALHKAREKNVPTVLIQHGMLGNDYPFFDYPVDRFIVKGKFWYELLSPDSQKRALILNSRPQYEIKKNEKKDFIVFITSAVNLAHVSMEVDVYSILLTLIKAISDSEYSLVIRVHPCASIRFYKEIVGKIFKENPIKLNIIYHQNTSIDELLEKTAFAIMPASTMFLDCIKHNIPIIAFKWIDFWIRERLIKNKIFNLAENLAELGKLVKRGMEGSLAIYSGDLSYFLESTREETLRDALKNTSGKSAIQVV